MQLLFESNKKSDYLEQSNVINFHHPIIQAKIKEIQDATNSVEEQAKLAFDFVRDSIHHSFDINSKIVTIDAADAMEKKEGICYTKSHVLAALLRGLGIPTGFCYQSTTRKGTPESGYGLHGLNAVYLPTREKWYRVDPRGNKPGVHTEFNLDQEQLAYTLKPEIGETDYPYVFAKPPACILDSLGNVKECGDLFYERPEKLSVDEDHFYKENEVK